MTTKDDVLRPGTARGPGASVQELLGHDPRARWPFTEESYAFLGDDDLPKQRYTSRAFHDAEVEKMWKKVWQVACRVEEIPNVGDTVVYDVAGLSLGVIRVDENTIKAFYNSCLHRGTALWDGDARVTEIRCPFHGFCWNLDGSIAEVPCGWEFPHVWGDDLKLPEALVDTWGGWVFVNPDRDAPPLETFLGDLVKHNAAFAYGWDRRYKAVHVAKVIPCNWKVGLEAFIESYHVPMAHGLGGKDDTRGQYDVWEGQPHFSRSIFGFIAAADQDAQADHVSLTAKGISSPPISGERVEAIRALDVENRKRWASRVSPDDPWGCWDEVTDEDERRVIRAVAKGGRDGLAELTGDDVSEIPDSELCGFTEYFIFPNILVWNGPLGNSGDLLYRFRPNGNDADSAVMDIMYLYPFGQNRHPPAATVRQLAPGEPMSTERRLGPLGLLLDQDEYTFSRLQRGLHAGGKPGVTLGNYNEVRIRHLHQTLDTYLTA